MPRSRGQLPIETVVLRHLEAGRAARAGVLVEHEARSGWAGLLAADPDCCVVEHRFDVVIQSDCASVTFLDGREWEGETAEEWRALLSAYAIPGVPAVLTDDQLLVAQLVSDEYPVAMCDELTRGCWFDWLDCLEDDTLGMFSFVDTISSEDDVRPGLSLPLNSGSLHWLRSMGVHPLCREQGLATSLLTHALWALRRADGDLAILEAGAGKTVFETGEPIRSVAAVRQLARRYRRSGFRRMYPRRRFSAEPEPMYMQFGAFTIPVARGF